MTPSARDALSVLVLLACASTAHAAPTYLPPFADGTPVYASDPAYVGADRLRVEAGMTGVSYFGVFSSYDIYINGSPATITPAPGGVRFVANIRVAASPATGTFPVGFAFTQQYDAPAYVPKPVYVEIVSKATGEVVLRRRSTYYDLDTDTATTPVGPERELNAAILAQLTPLGLDALEAVHQDDLPYPDDLAYDVELDALAMATPRRRTRPSGRCVPLDELVDEEPRWTDIPAVDGIKAAALAQAIVQEGLSLSPDPASRATAALMCVQSRPQNEDFEVCVRELTVDLTNVDVADVDDVDLWFGAVSGSVESDLTLVLPHADFDVGLRDLVVRYTLGGVGCLPPLDPLDLDNAYDITPEMVSDAPWLTDWVTCHDVAMDADYAVPMDPTTHLTARDGPQQAIEVTGTNAATFFIPGPLWDPDQGTCAGSWIRSAVRDAVQGSLTDVEQVLNDAWDVAMPERPQAEALDALLGGFELGLRPVPDTTFSATITAWESDDIIGLRARWRTIIEPLGGPGTVRAPRPWLYRSGPAAPWLDPSTGLDPDGQPFDLSIGMSLTHINQHLHSRASAAGPARRLRPTYEELGVAPPPGGADTDEAVLDGDTLGAWFPPFAALGRDLATITVAQRLPPMVWMEPDPVGVPFGQSPIGFWYPDVVVRIQRAVAPNDLLAEVHVDLWEPELLVALPLTFLNDDLWILMSNPSWYAVATAAPAGCPILPLSTPAPPTPCDVELADAVLELVRPEIIDAVYRVTQDLAVPGRFDTAPGGDRVRLTPTRKLQDSSYIGWFGELL
jgi:hypothetical protein